MNPVLRTLVIFSLLLLKSITTYCQTDREFWFVAPDIFDASRNFDKPIVIRVTAGASPATVTISLPANGSFTPIVRNVPANQTVSVDLTNWITLIENSPANTVLNKGILIQSTADITAYYDMVSGYCFCNPEIFALKGKNALGTEFYVSSQYTYDIDTVRHPGATQSFDIVATEDNTSITITPTKDIVGHKANIPFTITLNKGQTYSAVGTYRNKENHLQGSYITSTKPIAVTLKDDLVFGDGTGADLIGDQTVPTSVLGNEYIVTKGDLVPADRVFITAVENNTKIYVDGNTNPVATLSKGQSYTYSFSGTSTYITSSQKIYVYHVSGAGDELGAAIIPKTTCTGSKSVSVVRSSDRPFSIFVTTKKGNEGGFAVDGNTSTLSAANFSPVPGTNNKYVSAKLNLSYIVANGSAVKITNSIGKFSLGVISGLGTEGASYGFFSDFKSSNVQTSQTDICNGSSVQLNAFGGVSYQWSPLTGLDNGLIAGPMATPATSTNYKVLITDENGCVDSAFTLVTVKNCPQPVASFTAPDTVCVNAPVNITNTTGAASNYYWNFCVANVSQTPLGDNLGTLGGKFNRPVYIDYVVDNGNYYGFVTNNSSPNLIRLDFGNSLLNTPTAVNLGNPGGVLPNATTEGLQIVKNEGKWYVIIVGGDPSVNYQPFIAKVELGASITNNSPTGVNWGNIGGLNYPHDLFVFSDNGHWYGITANTSNSTLTRIDFGTSFSNAPTGTNLGNIGQLYNPTGLHAIKDNGRWFVFTTNVNNQSITRLDFGNSLLNTPTGYNLGNVGGQFRNPWDVYVMNFCDSILAFVSNSADGTLTKLNFGGTLLNNNPVATTFPNVGNQSFPHCLSKIFRVGADLFTFMMNVDNNTITRLRFTGCTNSSIPNSTQKDPPPVTYSTPGVYHINLAVDEGLSTQSSFCKSVVVVAPETGFLGDDISTCDKTYTIDATRPNAKSYLWNTGATTPSITVNQSGDYWVQVEITGKPCPSLDTININFKACVVASFTAPDTVCVNTPVNIVNTSALATNYFWNFCVANVGQPPLGDNLGTLGTVFNRPVYIDYVFDNGNYYGFVTNNSSGNLIRLDFGNSLLNTPISNNLGNPSGILPNASTEGLQVIKNEGKWYVLIVGGDASVGVTPFIAKVELGTSITNNAPTGVNWGNIGNLDYPHDLFVFNDNGRWYGMAANTSNNTITRLNFGTSFSNAPTGTNLGNIGQLYTPTGLHAIRDNGRWFVFVTNANSQSLTRLDFGSSLLSTPTGYNLGNVGGQFHNPWDVYVMNFCDSIVAFVSNSADGTLTKLNFGGSLLNNNPVANTFPNVGNQSFPHCLSKIFRAGSDLFTFMMNVDNNTITRLRFPGCTNSSIPNYPSKDPPPVTYSTPGTYNINLSVDEGLSTQTSFCKSVVVVEGERNFLGDDVSTCDKTYTIDATRPNAKSYLWNTGETTPTITVNSTADYWVQVEITGKPCPSMDTINVQFKTCAIASFTAPDTVCVNTTVKLNNTSINATSYYWSFCAGDIGGNITGEDLGNPGGMLSGPVFSDFVKVNGQFYVFVVNNYSGHITRLDFGNSLLNSPSAVDLGNFGGIIQINTEGIQIVNSKGNWYALVVGGDPQFGTTPQLYKINFGADITNTSPTINTYPNIGNMNQPIDLYTFSDNAGHYYGFTTNAKNNTITRLDFSTNLNNTPTAVTLGNIPYLDYPTGINALFNNGKWYVFVTNQFSHSVLRLDFGSSLLNTPVAVNLGTLGNVLSQPRDIYILQNCDKIIGYIVDANNTITRIDFNNNIESVPTATNLGNIGNFSFPHSISKIFREGADLYSFVTNVSSNTITRLKFPGCSNSSIPSFSSQTPPDIKYSDPGNYSINLTIDEGLSTQSSFCKSVVVLPAPEARPVLDTFLCRGDSVKLIANVKYGKYLWSTGSTDTAIIVKTADSYSVEYDYYGCKGKDDFTTAIKELPVVNLGADTSICKNDSLLLDPKNLGAAFLWQDKKTDSVYWVKTAGTYHVKVTDDFGCVQKDTIAVGEFALPVVGLPDSSYYCLNDSLQLDAGKNGKLYLWSTGASDQTTWIKSIGNYVVTVTDANGCVNKDSSYVSERALPFIDLIGDTAICKNDSLQLDAGNNAVKYAWQDGSSQNSFKIKQAGFYKVIITDKFGCSNADSLTVTTLELPVVNLAENAAICKNDSLLLDAGNNGVKYLWQDGSLNNTIWAKQAGKYIVAVTDANNCTNKDTTTLAILQLPVITLADNTTICIGSSAQINASSATATLYEWTAAPTLSAINISNPVATPTDTTKYFVKVTDANSCSSKDSITVNVVAVPTIAVKDTAICFGTSAVLKTQVTSTNKYDWSPATTLDNPASANPTATPAVKTTYTVKAINDGCSSTAQVTVDVLPLPVVAKSNDTTICIPGTAQLQASGGVSYKWYPVNGLSNALISNPLAKATTTTYYKVEVTDNHQCTKKDSVLVKVLPQPVFAVAPGNSPLCINDSLLVTASGGDIYQWQPATNILNADAATATVFPKATMDYKVTITNLTCNVTDVLTTHIKVNPLPTITVRKSNDIDCINPSTVITASGGAEYEWWPAEFLNDPTAIAPVASVLSNTEFYVKVTDRNTCSNVDSIMVNVTHDGENLFVVPNAFSPNGDGQNDCFSIRHWGVNNKLINFSIYDRWGVKVWSTTNIADCWDGTFKGQPQPSGGFAYIIHAKTICGDIVRKGMVILVR